MGMIPRADGRFRPGSNNCPATRYVTKHAMSSSKGIKLIRGILSNGGYFHYRNKDDLGFETAVPPGYHFDTFEEALANAEFQRERKLKDLRKRIKKFEKLTWVEPTDVIQAGR